MSYPDTIDSFTTKVDNVDSVIAADVNNLQVAISSIETKLGVTSSAIVDTIDYFLRHASGAFRTHTHDGTAVGGPNIPVENVIGAVSNPSSETQVMANPINEFKGADIASVAGVTDIGAATGNYIDVTGTNTITGLGTVQAGTKRIVRFTGVLILTYNATSLILPGGANITTAANDRAEFISLGSGNWICSQYTRASGTDIIGGGLVTMTVFTASSTWTKNAFTRKVIVEVIGGGGGGGNTNSSTAYGGPGGGGGYAKKLITSPGSTESVTIGAGGAGSGGPNDPVAASGGTSSFGSHVSASGGGGGGNSNVGSFSVGAQGSGSAGDINLTAEKAYFIDTSGHTTLYAGAAPFGFSSPVRQGEAGVNYGGGAGGQKNIGTPLNGTSGVVIVYEYA